MSANVPVKPESGRSDPNVIAANGKVALTIPLAQLQTNQGAELDLSLEYQSHMLKRIHETWTPELNTGLVAAGWGLSAHSRIWKASGEESTYWMYFKDALYQLQLKESAGGTRIFETDTPSNLNIQQDVANGYWIVCGIDGNRYIFGKDDSLNMEEGDYSEQTGTYTKASTEYNQVRALLANLENNQPKNSKADNTICSSVEKGVCWEGGWAGPSYNVSKQRQQATGWNLSHIEDCCGNRIMFSYIQHISAVCPTQGSKTYTVASYLYRIQVSNWEKSEKIVFVYAPKDTSEYHIDFTASERPNGMQQRFEKLYLAQVQIWDPERMTEKIMLETELSAREQLPKRLLKAVRFFSGQSPEAEYRPGYSMEYYGENDGVKVGQGGFDETHAYHNPANGALYGNLSAVVYPSGERRTYQYGTNLLGKVGRGFFQAAKSEEKDLHTIHTPYGYTILVRLCKGSWELAACTWTSEGWKYQTLLNFEGTLDPSTFPLERFISYSSCMIGFIGPGSKLYIFTRDAGGEGVWSNAPFWNHLKWNAVYGPLGKKAVAVGEDGVAFTTLLDSQKQTDRGYIWYFQTKDKGLTFELVSYANIHGLVDEGVNYHILLKVLRKRCLIVTLNEEKEEICPSDWNPSSWQPRYPDIKHYSVSVAVLEANNQMSAAKLGKAPILLHKHAWNKTSAGYKGLVLAGNNHHQALDIQKNGNLISLQLLSGMQWVQFMYSDHTIKQGESDPQRWQVDILTDESLSKFHYLIDGNIEEREIEREPNSIFAMETMLISTQSSRTGSITSYYYAYKVDVSTHPETYGTVYCNYDGSEVQKTQNHSKKNLLCAMKDDVFACFETKEGENVVRKTYQMFSPQTMQWSDISTGSIEQSSTSYNTGAAKALEVLEYLGLALFIILTPLGIGSVAGAIFTVMSVSLMVASFAAQAIFNNSVKASLNPSSSFFGNRFINDGTTIWFRESDESKLTAIGAGTSLQPHDALSDSTLDGNIITGKQPYGLVYGFVPFMTDKNRIYYRRLKNDRVGAPVSLGGLSEGYGDLYYDNDLAKTIAFSGPYELTFDHELKLESRKRISDSHPYFSSVDGCVRITGSSNDEGTKLITASGEWMCMTCDGVTTPPVKLQDAIRGTSFRHVDCMAGLRNGTFYLFQGTDYEIAELTEEGFKVLKKGKIKQLHSDLPFETIDASFVDHNGWSYYLSNGRYAAYDYTGKLSKQGRVGQDCFWETYSKDNSKMSFASETLVVWEPQKGLQLFKFLDDGMDGGITDYTVKNVCFYTDPRMEQETSKTYYEYDTKDSVYSEAVQSALYSCTDVCVEE